MPLTDAQLREFDKNVLKLPIEQYREYLRVTDGFLKDLKLKYQDSTEICVKSFEIAGSFAKGTNLRVIDGHQADIDVVLFISKRMQFEQEQFLTKINENFKVWLPNAEIDTQSINPNVLTVETEYLGLKLDIVPVIDEPGRDGYGKLVNLNGDQEIDTCPKCIVELIEEKSQPDPDLKVLIRLAKMWRNHKGLKKLGSFMIELIMIHLQNSSGIDGSVEFRFSEFLGYLAGLKFKKPINITNIEPIGVFRNDVVIIIDPICGLNNVASSIGDKDRDVVIKVARESCEIVKLASKSTNLDNWKQIFGPRFRIM